VLLAKKHKIKQGDSVIQLSEEYGFFAQTIWDDPDNSQLKEQRPDMDCLMPGDVVAIPDKTEKQVDGATEKRHRFRRKGVPAIYRLQVFDIEEPRANQKYQLVVDGHILEGKTDDTGTLEQWVPTGAKKAELIIGPDDHRMLVDFGHLDPISEVAGIQKRLNNLGFFCGDPDGELNDDTTAALAEFQARFELDSTGQLDDATRDKLQEVHDSSHEFDTPQEQQ